MAGKEKGTSSLRLLMNALVAASLSTSWVDLLTAWSEDLVEEVGGCASVTLEFVGNLTSINGRS